MQGLLGRLRLSRRFALLGFVALLLVGPTLVMTIYRAQQDVAAAAAEQRGLEPVRAAMRVIQLVQQHGGLAANVLGGRTEIESQRAAKQAEVERAAEAYSGALQRGAASPEIVSAWERAAAGWKSLAQGAGARTLSGRDSLAGHTALVAEQLRILDLIGDHYGLTLDPKANGHHLVMASIGHLPHLTEALGEARTRGTLYLAQRVITAEERVAMLALVDLVNMHYGNMVRAIGKALEANPGLRERLGSVARESDTLVREGKGLTREQIIEAPLLDHPSTDYFNASTRVIDGQFRLLGAALDALDGVLGERLKQARFMQVAVVSALGAGIAFALWLGVAVARSILAPLGGEPEAAVAIARRVAQGDLTLQVDTRPGDTGSLLYAMGGMRQGLVTMVVEIKAASEAIESAAKQIAAGNADLSSRTEEQASTLEETASSMEELTATLKQNASNASRARDLAAGAADLASRGGQAMAHVVGTMDAIAEAGQRIADIIGVIDGIAFQTNILALNAAVEAARAGEQGRGFAVVASEVRALAQRSAGAAKEIRDLIQAAVARVGEGNQLVETAGETIAEVVSAVKRVDEAVSEITTATHEQLSGIEHMGRAVAQLDKVVQQNAALVEESAAAAEAMAGQAEGLVRSTARFRLADPGGAASVPAAPAVVTRRADAGGPKVLHLPGRARQRS